MNDLQVAWKFGMALGILRGLSLCSDIPKEYREYLLSVLPKLEVKDEVSKDGK